MGVDGDSIGAAPPPSAALQRAVACTAWGCLGGDVAVAGSRLEAELRIDAAHSYEFCLGAACSRTMS
jgi:hypothetical protein